MSEQQKSDRKIEFGGMLLMMLVIASIVWYYLMPRHEPRHLATTAMESPGKVLKGIAFMVDHTKKDDQKILISQDKMPEALKHEKVMRESLLKNREHLPDKYVAGLLWTETELILVIVPTDKPITMDQVHAFVEIIWALEKSLGDHMKRRDVVITTEGPLKGGHGVALPLKKSVPEPKKPAA